MAYHKSQLSLKRNLIPPLTFAQLSFTPVCEDVNQNRANSANPILSCLKKSLKQQHSKVRDSQNLQCLFSFMIFITWKTFLHIVQNVIMLHQALSSQILFWQQNFIMDRCPWQNTHAIYKFAVILWFLVFHTNTI